MSNYATRLEGAFEAQPDLTSEIVRLKGEAGVLRDLLSDCYSYLDPTDAEDCVLRGQIDAAIRGAT